MARTRLFRLQIGERQRMTKEQLEAIKGLAESLAEIAHSAMHLPDNLNFVDTIRQQIWMLGTIAMEGENGDIT